MKRSWRLWISLGIVGITASLINCDRARADFGFGAPRNVGPVINSGVDQAEASIAHDGLSIYFSQGTMGVSFFLNVATRPTRDVDWGNPIKLGPQVQSSFYTGGQHIAPDELTLFYSPMFEDGYGGPGDLWMTTRSTIDDPWGAPVILGEPVNSSSEEWAPSLSGDTLSLCFMSTRPGGQGQMDLWMCTRASQAEDWMAPVNLGPKVNSSDFEGHPSLSADGCVLFFQSPRIGGLGGYDIWMTTRKTRDDVWDTARNLGPGVNSTYMDGEPCISADGSTLYFTSARPGGYGNMDLWEVPLHPVVEFNGDGMVDTSDLLQFIQSWGQDDALFDIGPTPFGDGVVDAADLEVLMSVWGQEVADPTLKACWKLDESEGDIAYDSAAENDAVVMGNAQWRPDSGHVNGALQFDGIDDCVNTPFGLNPADAVFSVIAWVMGGTPGQVILSQESSVNWLMADAGEGALRTDIADPVQSSRHGSRGGLPLISPTTVTDGNWHRVGLVWTGSDRILYVDDIEVARDSLTSLESTKENLCIGTGAALQSGAFWSGLIDDVRIYDRVVKP